MKKIAFLILCFALLLSSCGTGDKIEIRDDVYPSELITVEELTAFIGYTPVMNETRSRRVSVALYTSDPIGKEDIVEIKLRQKNGLQSEEEIREYFDECKEMRPDALDVRLDNQNAEAFIAYPTLHYYINGYHIEVTAGSGNDDLQKNLLQNIANITLENLIIITDMDVNNDIITEDSVNSQQTEDTNS